jgi:hypothetical protein
MTLCNGTRCKPYTASANDAPELESTRRYLNKCAMQNSGHTLTLFMVLLQFMYFELSQYFPTCYLTKEHVQQSCISYDSCSDI